MSLYSLAQNEAQKMMARTALSDTQTQQIAHLLEEIQTVNARQQAAAAAPEADRQAQQIQETLIQKTTEMVKPADNMVAAFTKYIPAESIALYLAILPAVNASREGGLVLYIVMAILTPIILLLVASALEFKTARANNQVLAQPLVRRPMNWPKWKMFGAFVAFVVWGLSIPGNPAFFVPPTGMPTIEPIVTSALTVFISYLLTLVGNAFGWDPD